MAFQKDIMTDMGFNTTYHILAAVHWYTIHKVVHIDIASYASLEAFNNGMQPVITRQFEFKDDKYPFSGDTITTTEAYAVLKTAEMFHDAIEI